MLTAGPGMMGAPPPPAGAAPGMYNQPQPGYAYGYGM